MPHPTSEPITHPTPEQFEQWDSQHGEIFTIEVSDEDTKVDPYTAPPEDDTVMINAVVGYLKKPDDRILSFALSKMPQVIEAGKVLLKSCWIGGDSRILNEPGLFLSAALQCTEFLKIKQARLKKHSPTGTK